MITTEFFTTVWSRHVKKLFWSDCQERNYRITVKHVFHWIPIFTSHEWQLLVKWVPCLDPMIKLVHLIYKSDPVIRWKRHPPWNLLFQAINAPVFFLIQALVMIPVDHWAINNRRHHHQNHVFMKASSSTVTQTSIFFLIYWNNLGMQDETHPHFPPLFVLNSTYAYLEIILGSKRNSCQNVKIFTCFTSIFMWISNQ